MRSYPGFCRRKQLEYNPGLTHRRRAGHPRANRRTSDRPSFCGVRPSCSRVIMSFHIFQCRTPCGVRQEHKPPNTFAAQFQSTHPLRGATDTNTGESHVGKISIHAPLAGCDPIIAAYEGYRTKFQSTHPLRGATSRSPPPRWGSGISIHAPLAGCDCAMLTTRERTCYFNPRTPCGVRRSPPLHGYMIEQFQSTHPLRGATLRCRRDTGAVAISIHAPLAGCDAGRACQLGEF